MVKGEKYEWTLIQVEEESIGNFKYLRIVETTVNQLKNNGYLPDYDYKSLKLDKKKPDGLLFLNDDIKALVEWKQPKNFNDEVIAEVVQDRKKLLKLLRTILIITDGERTRYYNSEGVIIKNDNQQIINFPFNLKNNKSDLSSFLFDFFNRLENPFKNTLIEKSYTDPTLLSKKIWQIIWQAKGASPESSLYAFVELFIFKYISDLGILKGYHSFDYIYNSLFSDNNSQNNNQSSGPFQVLNYYVKLIRPEMKRLFPESMVDKTTIINGCVFVSKDNEAVRTFDNIFKLIIKEFHNFGKLDNVHPDFKTKLFETFLKESISVKNWGQFFTPLKVVQSIVNMFDLQEGMKICDPACGVWCGEIFVRSY